MNRQVLRLEDLAGDGVGERHLGGRNEVHLLHVGVGAALLRGEEVLLELRQLPRAGHGRGGDDVRGVALRIALLAGVHVKHELREGAVKVRNLALHEAEARARELGGRVEVEAQGGADVDVVLDLEVKLARHAPAADLDVLGLVLADRGGRRGKVRDAKEQVMKLRADLLELGLELGELGGDLRGLGEQLRSVLAFLLLHADVLGEGVARGLQLLGLLLDVLAAVLKLREGLNGEIEIARLQAIHHFLEILPEHRHIEHVCCPWGAVR